MRYLSHKESLYKHAYAEAERSAEFLIESTIWGVFNMEVRRKLIDDGVRTVAEVCTTM